MRRHMTRRRLTVAVFGLVVAAALVAASAFGAFAHNRTATTNSAGAGNVKVHGRWTIVVRNTTGRVVSRRRFENSLTGNGAELLRSILTRHSTAGRWSVALEAPQQVWVSTEPDATIDGEGAPYELTNNLAVTISGTAIELSGSVTAMEDASVGVVGTDLDACDPSVLPAACTGFQYSLTGGFTSATLSPQIAVTNGQLVQVTVKITFS